MTRIVGLGASAGGLVALEQFLAKVPQATGLAYVVVQHLDPAHKALLSELLQRSTALPVCEVTESMPIKADTVYVIPPGVELTVTKGRMHLTEPSAPRGLRLPIDVFFQSLARDQGESAIGVVLSGMGSDGTHGLRVIKMAGGLTLAQEPASAQFDSMPRSAIAAGCVDIVAQPGDMLPRILQVMSPGSMDEAVASDQEETGTDVTAETSGPAILERILAQLSDHGVRQLSLYKPSTLRRRIERRMAVHGLATMAEYERFLRANQQEAALLFAEVLIGVTSFFRDPAVWDVLKKQVMPDLLARTAPQARLRAWVAGCSTGEEAYSLAMVFSEVVAANPKFAGKSLQIFATDVSPQAIAAGRRGWYPGRIADEVGQARLAKFFVVQGNGYLVGPQIREMVLFAQHDVIMDPPFTRLDILCCRNLLIYFNASLQQRLVPLFHYSLRPGGLLLLGESETAGRSQDLFTLLDPSARLYRRNEVAADAVSVEFPTYRRSSAAVPPMEAHVPSSTSPPANLQALADHVLLQQFAPPAVLVNASGDIVYISGRTGRFLEPAAGKANWNIHVMARPGIRSQLAVAIRQTLLDGKAMELRGLRLDDDSRRELDLTVQQVKKPEALAGLVMVVFREGPELPAAKSRRRSASNADAAAMSEALNRSREEVAMLRQEMQASQEELQAANEELQSINEELQSANEELTTSKEEAQSMNEELQTINSELQSRLDDLALAQSDMQNLLNSTEIATLFLDNDLNVRRFTDKATRLIHLRDGDIGRPLSDLTSTLNYPELGQDAAQTLRTLTVCEKQVSATDGSWYSVRILPYRTLANVIQGVVITLVDITAAKQLESRLRDG